MRVESRLPDASPNKSTALICAGLGVACTHFWAARIAERGVFMACEYIPMGRVARAQEA